MDRRSLRRSALLVLLPTLIALMGAVVPRAPLSARTEAVPAASVQAQSPAGLDTIEATFTLLMDQFYRSLDPAVLLSAAWEGATSALSDAGVSGTLPAAPDFSGGRDAALSAFRAAYPRLVAVLPASADPLDLAFVTANAMTTSVHEGHTFFLVPRDYTAFTSSLGGEEEAIGLGVRLAQTRAPWFIADVAPDGPADRAGVKPGDTLVTANGVDVTDATPVMFSRAIGGPAGTVVRLTVSRPGVAAPVALTVARGPYKFPNVTSRILPGGIGYIRLEEFTSFVDPASGARNGLREIDAAIDRFNTAGVTAWVIDLRNNPGGFVFTNTELSGRFIGDAATGVDSDERGHRAIEIGTGRPYPIQRPMAVLINGGSASSSEVFSSAMQEHGRAVIVGEQSAGALATGYTFPVPNGAGVNIAIAATSSGNGVVIDEVGVTPDFEVEDTRTAEDYAAGRDPQLQAAVAALASAPVPATPPARPSATLSQESLRALLGGYLPDEIAVPATDLIPEPSTVGDLLLTYPAQYLGDVRGFRPRDPAGVVDAVRARGWQGSATRVYGGPAGLAGPALAVGIDLYGSESGAIAALNTNDSPQTLRSAPPPVQLGDGAVAYEGTWVNAGSDFYVWRSGRAVVWVWYGAVPGKESFEPVIALARAVDVLLAQRPVPAGGPATAPAAPSAQQPAGAR